MAKIIDKRSVLCRFESYDDGESVSRPTMEQIKELLNHNSKRITLIKSSMSGVFVAVELPGGVLDLQKLYDDAIAYGFPGTEYRVQLINDLYCDVENGDATVPVNLIKYINFVPTTHY